MRQLPGDMVLAALPDATPEDATMKTIVQNNCTACHTPSYILQHKFDEAGWNAIINLMKHANVYGVYQGPDHKASPVLDHNQKQLAAYLARARGPGETSMKFNLRPRPRGEAARVVFTIQPILPGRIYLAPGGSHMTVARRSGQPVISLNDGPQRGSEPMIIFFLQLFLIADMVLLSVVDLETCALGHHADEVLADIMKVSANRAHEQHPGGL